MGETSIEWTRGDDGSPGRTWNCLRGCSKESEGCRFCYAMGIGARFSGPGLAYEGLALMKDSGPAWTGVVRLIEERLRDPLRWKKPSRIFVNSMSDMWHESLSWEREIDRIWQVMVDADWHTYQCLTKRAENMRDHVQDWYRRARVPLLRQVWLGVSIENRKALDRLHYLRETPAAVHFVSFEPLLEDLGKVDLRGVEWAIAGAESGSRARTMSEDWVRSLRDQCGEQGVKFFYKQRLNERGHKVSLPVLDGRQWAEFPRVEGGR
jgi:protein gp37